MDVTFISCVLKIEKYLETKGYGKNTCIGEME
jgi:hypothetical protein